MWRIGGALQSYAWGDPTFIPALMGREPTGQPVAEAWYGVNAQGPSPLLDHGGTLAAAEVGDLPFLLKLLAAAIPLSIQVHPSAEQAAAGFAREERLGIARDAPDRTYRDPNPKPELIVALTPFVAACGFRPLDRTRALFEQLGHVALDGLRTRLSADGPDAEVLADVLGWLLSHDTDDARQLVAATVLAASSGAVAPEFALEQRWTPLVHRAFPGDIGVVVALLLNHVELAPGEGLYLDAGNLHAYLGGAGVEIMANSDNVVRGGLTSKHIDRDELLAIVDATPIEPTVQRAAGAIHRYAAPTPWFSLERHELNRGELAVEPEGAEIVLVVAGRVQTPAGPLRPGEALAVAAADGAYAVSGSGTLWRATTGGRAER